VVTWCLLTALPNGCNFGLGANLAPPPAADIVKMLYRGFVGRKDFHFVRYDAGIDCLDTTLESAYI